MYSKVVLDVFKNPKNIGRISKPDGIASNFNADNTSNVEFSMRVNDGLIADCKFRAQANPYIIAICSTITEMLKGKMVSLLFIDPYTVTKTLGADENIDFTFCIDCVKMMIDDFSEKLAKANKGEVKNADKGLPVTEQDENQDGRIIETNKKNAEDGFNSFPMFDDDEFDV